MMTIRLETKPISLNHSLKFYRIKAFGGSVVDLLIQHDYPYDDNHYYMVTKSIIELPYYYVGYYLDFEKAVNKIRKRNNVD